MGYSTAQAKEFINQIAPLIVAEGKKRGYSVFSTVISQAIVESASNTSILGYKYGNYFGLKCGSSWKGDSVNLSTKEEYTAGTLTNIKANFRVFQTNGVADMAKGVAGYYDFISKSRYADLKPCTDYKRYAEILKSSGYATSSSYVNTLCSTVTKYDLTKYDSQAVDKSNDEIAQEVIAGKWGNGTDRVNRLTQAGYDPKVIQSLVNNLVGGNDNVNKILRVARTELGVKESPANSNNVKYNTEYYGREVSGSAYPWCCVFVWWVFKHAGLSELFCHGKKTALCEYVKTDMKTQIVKEPKAGDLILFQFDSDPQADHIGIVESVNADGSVVTIEGNTSTGNDSNGGQVMRRTRKKSVIMCFIRPKY